MKDIRVDSEGEFRCWNCGNKGLLAKRTFRSKVMVGVGALLTKKKLKCQTCGEFNDTGSAKPYDGPASRKWRKRWEQVEKQKTAVQRADEHRQAQVQADAIASALVSAATEHRQQDPAALIEGVPEDIERPVAEIRASHPSPPPPPSWSPDPTGRHEHRYWDGGRWTDQVSDQGVQATDPMD